MADLAAEYREKLLDAVVETDDALMEAYLGGEELDPAAVAAALKTAVTNDQLYPVACGVATKNLGTHALLDLLVEGIPSPARKALARSTRTAAPRAFVFKTVADPFAGRINAFRVYGGTVAADSTLVNLRDKAKERLGGADDAAGQGAREGRRVRRRRHRRRREAQGRPDRRPARRLRARRSRRPSSTFPSR